MALHRGIQSAVFYYLSCAPCTGYAYRKKRRREATRDRADKLALEEEQPGLYRHPSPFATNPYWQTEIDLGPSHGSSARRKKDKNTPEAWALSSVPSQSSGEAGSKVTSSSDLDGEGPQRNDSRLNVRRYQREDEELWGTPVADHSHRKTPNLDGPGSVPVMDRPPTAKTNKTDRSGKSYHSLQNPQINDFHPAIITKLESKEDAKWMLQPPPAARVMLGKDRANRSRSDSGGSRLSSRKGADDKSVRHVTETLLEENPPRRDPDEQRPVSRSKMTEGNGRVRKLGSAIDLNDAFDDATPRPQRRRRQKQLYPSEESAESSATVIRRPQPSTTSHPNPIQKNFDLMQRPSRSKLFSRTSETPSPRTRSPLKRAAEPAHSSDSSRDFAARRPPIFTTDSSLNVLQEVVPTSRLLNASKAMSKVPSFEAKISLPPVDRSEELDLKGWDARWFERADESDDLMDAEAVRALEGRESFFPQWAAERVTRTVTHRWSMDI